MQTAFRQARTDSEATTSSPARPRNRRIAAWLLAGWAVLSLAWAAFMLMDLYDRAAAQADMSREVELDLDAASCSGGPCDASLHTTRQEEWSDIAETYLQFGYVSLLEWIILPPAVLLAMGVGGTMLIRRRAAVRA